MQRRVLIVRTDKVGDVVMITPMIREIKKTYPDSFIATLTNSNTQDLLLNNSNLDVAMSDDLSKKSFWKVIGEIRKYKFTDGLLVMPTERAAYQMFIAGVKNRIGVGRKIYEVITYMKSISRKKYVPLRHEADYSMDLARAIGVKSENLKPEIFITEGERNYGKNMLSSNGIYERDYKIIVHTGSGNSSRNWCEDKYYRLLIKILEEKKGSKIILTAKEMTSEFRAKIKDLGDERIVFVDEEVNRLRDLICIIANVDLLISSSTGPLHIASALEVKSIGLYCHRRMNCVKHWGALGGKAVNLEISKEYCDSNCSRDKEDCNFEEGITLEQVIASV